MHLALFIERLDPAGSGQERTTIELSRRLIGRGHRITFYTGDAPPFVRLEGAAICNGHTLDFKHHVKPAAFARWARGQLATMDCDASLSVTSLAPATVVMPLTGTVRERVRRRRAGHRDPRGGPVDMLLKLAMSAGTQASLRLERSALADRRVRLVVAVSDYVRRQLLEHELVEDHLVRSIPLGLEPPSVSDPQRAIFRRRIRQAFHVPDDAVAFLFASHHPMWKGAATVLRAMKLLVDQVRHVGLAPPGAAPVLLLAGHITFAQQRLAAELGIRDQVRMIGPTERMAELYCAADVSVSATNSHACSRVTLESLAMGVPVITTAYDGAAEWLDGAADGGAGMVIAEPCDAPATADAMRAMLDTTRRGCSGQAATALAPRLTGERFASELERALTESSR
jgi:glycosyltransferase involved in cell wall biosynthesis